MTSKKKLWIFLGTIFIVLAVLIIIQNLPEKGPRKYTEEEKKIAAQKRVEELKKEIKQVNKIQKPKKAWRTIARWQGKAIKDTESFYISSNEWRISWETQPGEFGSMNFQIYVYKSNGDLVSVAANVIGFDKDSTIMRGAGIYYLTINTAQPYKIIIEEKR